MRVYFPATIAHIPQALAGDWSPGRGFAVTSRLLDVSAHEELDLLAEQAIDAAVIESQAASPDRRVVIVADIPRGEMSERPEDHPAAVDVSGAIAADAIVCAFIDEDDASEGDSLMWFGPTELEQF